MDSLFTLVVGSGRSNGADIEDDPDQMKLYSVYKPGGVPLGFDIMDQALDKVQELVRGDAELILGLTERAE